MSELIPIESAEPLITAAAQHYRTAAGKLANITIGLDDLVVVVHRYLGDNFGVVTANVGAWGPVKGESQSRPIGLFNASQVGAFAEYNSLIPARSELPETYDFVRYQVAPLEWQPEETWLRLRDRLMLCRPLWPVAGRGLAVKQWLDTEVAERPDPRSKA